MIGEDGSVEFQRAATISTSIPRSGWRDVLFLTKAEIGWVEGGSWTSGSDVWCLFIGISCSIVHDPFGESVKVASRSFDDDCADTDDTKLDSSNSNNDDTIIVEMINILMMSIWL